MKKIIIATAITAIFSTVANASLVDRINEARSYPNKTVETVGELLGAKAPELLKRTLARGQF